MVADPSSNSFEIGFVDGPHLAHHDDLFVRLRAERFVFDSYYFETWQHRGQYAGLNAYTVLAAAASNWIRAVRTTVAPAFLYFPFGLDDECVNWISIELKNENDVLVGVGWNRENGYSIDPINGIRTAEPPGLQPDAEAGVPISRDSLVHALTRFCTCIDRELENLQIRIDRERSESPGSTLTS